MLVVLKDAGDADPLPSFERVTFGLPDLAINKTCQSDG